MHIRALAGADVVHLFIFRRTLLLFQVAHVGDLFDFQDSRFSVRFNSLWVVFSPGGRKNDYIRTYASTRIFAIVYSFFAPAGRKKNIRFMKSTLLPQAKATFCVSLTQ